jgi:hypothetical protein
MEDVAGLMQNLKLSEEELQGVKRDWRGSREKAIGSPQAIGKLLSEKPAHPDAICQSLGFVWCPIRGIKCRDMGENIFLFTFKQESGKRKALEEGPWMFEKELIIMEDFVPSKRLGEYEFSTIPIWVRVFGLPLGMMDRTSGELVGRKLGVFEDMEAGEDGMAIGKFMRVKVRIQVAKALLCGVMMEVDEDGRKVWCPLTYEFLPDFCFICGKLGHGMRSCSIKLSGGEKLQFGNWMKADMGRRRVGEEASGRRGEVFGSSSFRGFGNSRWGGRSRSDSDSWRKSDSRLRVGREGRLEIGEGVTNLGELGRDVQTKGAQTCLLGGSDKPSSRGVDNVEKNSGALILLQEDIMVGGKEMELEDGTGEGTLVEGAISTNDKHGKKEKKEVQKS